MLPLLWCLAWSAGIALDLARPSKTSPLVFAALALAAALYAMVQLRRGQRATAAVLLAAGLAGVARGRVADLERAALPATGLVHIAVVGASVPVGSSCSVLGRTTDSGAETWSLLLPAEICPLAHGDLIWVSAGDLSPRRGAPWPGAASIDPGREGAVAAFTAEGAWRAGPPAEGAWRRIAALRHGAVLASRGDPALGFVVASVLGQPAALPPERRAELRRAGLGHVVAVSGMNVAVAAALFHAPLVRVALLVGGGSRLAAALLSWLPVLAYLGLTGGEPPALRAAVMFALWQASALLGRPGHGLTALALAAAGLLAWRPAWALDPGLHLSLAAMAVLVHPDAPRGLLAQSWRLSWGTLPIALVHFGDASLVGVLSNLVAVPVFTLWVLPLGIAGLCAWPWLATEGLRPAALGGQAILDVAALAARSPAPPALAIAALALLALWLRARRGRWLAARPGVAAWVPGGLTCAAALTAALLCRRAPEEPPRRWVAIGGPRSAAVIVPATDDPSLACVRDPWLAPEAWPELLPALGFRGAGSVEGPRSPGATAAAREALARAGMLSEATCPEGPDLKTLRPALAACLERAGGRRATVRAGLGEGPPECWTGTGWEP